MRIELTKKPLDRDTFPLANKALDEGLVEGVAPGFVAGFWSAKTPSNIFLTAIGQRRITPTTQPMTTDTVFDLASVTKVFVTTSLLARLIERGWLSWETKVKSVLPDFPSSDVTIAHLASHSSGLPSWLPFWEMMRKSFVDSDSETKLFSVPFVERQKQMRSLVLATPLECAPGSRMLYSDLGFLLLGFIIEDVLSMPLDFAAQKLLWEPFGIEKVFFSRTTKSVLKGRNEICAATENCSWRGGVLQGQVHDDNCWSMGGVAGHAGAFATAEEVLKFSIHLFTGLLDAERFRDISNRIGNSSRTLGWDTPSGDTPSAGKFFSDRSFGHNGYTGTSLWIDAKRRLAFVLFSNRVHPTRANPKIIKFRQRFYEGLSQDLVLNR